MLSTVKVLPKFQDSRHWPALSQWWVNCELELKNGQSTGRAYRLSHFSHRDWSCRGHVAIMDWSRGWSYTDHVTDHALITCLIMNWALAWSCTYHVAHHALNSQLIIPWSQSWSYTDYVTVHALITWLILHCSCGWSCTDYLVDHTLITLLIMN